MPIPTKITTCAERLKTIMEERGLRQVDILNLTEPLCREQNKTMTKSDVSHYVLDKCLPAKDKLLMMAKALDISPAWLAGFDVPVEPNESDADIEDFLTGEANKKAVNKEILQKVGGDNLGILFWRASEHDRDIIRLVLSKYSENATVPNSQDTGYLSYTDTGLLRLPVISIEGKDADKER